MTGAGGNEFVEQPIYQQLSRIAKAMSNPGRLRLLDLLDTTAELTVEELSAASGIALKNTSAQLQDLRANGLVVARRDGVRMFYRLAGPAVSEFLGRYQRFAADSLADLRAEIQSYLGGAGQWDPVGPDELARLREQGVLLVDVRSADDYAHGHIPGAVSLPLSELTDRLTELPADTEVVAYCQGPYCVASPRAAQTLADNGFRVRTLDGGYAAWVRLHGRTAAACE
ncbi:ArsR/SmtB family transcription factor [Nakamurella aerolata]|uniref:Metalloregulator ArsR/SmtB family transcription factor n=1 Tax=Nakamurella aerolata TaxID=1656892 RepID=A0A849A9F1_9ACTN|nr:ArsR family transcriptional regulator [Nakamurella aerolata]NNG35728.1 metalloregulator ArsR/SmtB family transcription factor [Nakamurella aerolata]